ncbi:1,6-anhydro-N-acetylmuramyl-L-alanine amidase AmpD [Saccharophagus degradans]|uniref:1,6-anhydro-N-acetylmuramyl-L-alanine amidase AmpD n=1 Tax=Saccharophagus degradans TaxID=86304 RepID=UPI0024781FFA|nr:1,6-anhydro-N-acetylmuramyl-L-alanine amidase AmpD [Saccharophagus degradans]WGO97684.1 1,6-anhydro-N-acetylmuramyl-L-alanine amidase AmpD [Saccharophagus degradans]
MTSSIESQRFSVNAIEDGWWQKALKLPSPNFNARPPGSEVSLLVIHNISLPPGGFGGGYVEAFFLNKLNPSDHPYFETIAEVEVSAHCFIDRHGHVTQFVSFDDRAWHAGRSSFNGEQECNDFGIGIELEGTDSLEYTVEQYASLVELSAVLLNKYPKLTLDRIVGHCDIAPERKTDPGEAFDWQNYKSELAKRLQERD